MPLIADTPLAPLTTLRLGGPARRMIVARSDGELVDALTRCDDAGEPVLLLAGGSNVVVSDDGFDGTVVRLLTRGVELDPSGDLVTVRAAAGEPWDRLVARLVDEGLAGVECLSGIPGSTGATPVQNVGAYGQEVADTIVSVDIYDRVTRTFATFSPAQCGFGYRASRFKHQDRLVVTAVTFALQRSALSRPVRYAELARRLGVDVGAAAPLPDIRQAVLGLRRGKGMVVDPDDPDSVSAGSFFTNPVVDAAEFAALQQRVGRDVPHFLVGDEVKLPAAWLIERAGFAKGYGAGAIGISTKHTLALVNRGGGTTRELLDVARTIRDRVREEFDIELRPEPVIVGEEW